MDKHLPYMQAALEEANKAAMADEVPVGAVVVHDNTIIARGYNVTRIQHDPSAHAEMVAIRAACDVMGAQRIPECDLYVTLEPCTMCAAAISFARIRTLVFGADDPKGGGVLHGAEFFEQPTCHHKPGVVYGILAEPCGQILKDFFRSKRS